MNRKVLKAVIVGMFALGAVSLAVPAQAAKADKAAAKAAKGDKAGNPQLEKLKEAVAKLDLTADQQTKVDAIFADAKTKSEAAHADANGDKQAAKDKLKTIASDTRDQITALLTPEQKAKFHELQKAKRAKDDGTGDAAKTGAPTTAPAAAPGA